MDIVNTYTRTIAAVKEHINRQAQNGVEFVRAIGNATSKTGLSWSCAPIARIKFCRLLCCDGNSGWFQTW